MESALGKALAYLAGQQQNDGSFISYSSAIATPFQEQHRYHTTFTPAFILSALSHIDDPVSLHIRQGLARFLLSQKSPQWSFNYWARKSQEAKKLPYPDDLDDTFCALSALWLHDRTLINGATLAKITKLLLATESQVGGPYRTWLIAPGSPKTWQDVDLAVNANINHFLSLAAQPLPNLTALMEQTIQQQTFHSPYYPHLYPIVYFIARAYQGAEREALALFLQSRQQKNGSWGTPLHTALAMTSLMKLGHSSHPKAARFLLSTQQADGSWPAEAFCLDPARGGQQFYNGSSALTTAMALEALYLQQPPKETPATKQLAPANRSQRIITLAAKEFKQLDRDLRQPALEMIERIAQSRHSEEITLLPRLFYDSLSVKKSLQASTFESLGLANLYGWMAYTIYDDFLDKEGVPRLLSVANLAMRRSMTAFYKATPHASEFHHLVQRTFDRMDEANAWEVANCRFVVKPEAITITKLPHYGRLDRLAERSAGHALTPLAILAMSGYTLEGAAVQNVCASLRHSLIARQLNDDIHDWQADLAAGRISYVVARILQDLGIPLGEQAWSVLHAKAGPQFWHHTLPHICRKITYHTTQSRQAAAKSRLLLPHHVIEEVLDDIDASVSQTRTTLATARQFLQMFHQD